MWDQKVKDYEALKVPVEASGPSWDGYCRELAYQLHPERHYNALPQAYTQYAKCLERGYAKQPADHELATKMLYAAAQCGEREAIELLCQRSMEVPVFAGCKPETYFSFCFEEQMCGLSQEVTPIGYVLLAPVAIPVGAALMVGALVSLPICALFAPFFGGRCM